MTPETPAAGDENPRSFGGLGGFWGRDSLSNRPSARRQKLLAAVIAALVGGLSAAALWLAPDTDADKHTKPLITDLTLKPERAQRESYVIQTERRADALEARIERVEKAVAGMRDTLKTDLASLSASVRSQSEKLTALDRKASDLAPGTASDVPADPAAPMPDRFAMAEMPPAGADEPYPPYPDMAAQAPGSSLAIAVIDPRPEGTKKPAPLVAPLIDPDAPLAANRSQGRLADAWLPAGSFAPATLLTGLYASTGGASGSQPIPVLMRIDAPAMLPSHWRSEIASCHVTGAATGDLSSERVHIRLDRLSCISVKGETLDIKAGGYAVGRDGKTGVRGRLVTRSGQAIANALSLSVLSGVGRAVSLSAQQVTTSSLTGTQTVDYSSAWKAGMGEGFASGMQRLIDYYLKLADKVLPVLELQSGTPVDIVFSQGVHLAPSQNP